MINPDPNPEEFENDEIAIGELTTAGKWARFIGITYLVIGGITLLSFILLILNQNAISSLLMEMNHMSVESVQFLMNGGKVIYGLVTLIAVSIMWLNAYWLIKFHSSSRLYQQTNAETQLALSFQYLSKYLQITVLLGILSLIVSILGVLFSVRI
jgi:hypothetical protein